MLDVKITGYVVPLAEQPQASLTPVISVENVADEAAVITGLIRIYRESTGLMIYSSQLAVTQLEHHSTTNIAALTPFDPPAPADDDYFVKADITATSYLPGPPTHDSLGAWHFDIKTPPMGEAPAGHHVTHEEDGSDEIEAGALGTTEMVAALVLAPDGTGGVEFRAEAGGGGSGLSETPQVLTDQAAIDWDLSLGGAATITLGGDRTLNEATNMVNGTHASLRVKQDDTGTRLLTWHATYRFPGGVDPALSAAIGNEDILLFSCDGTHMDCVGMVSALA